MFNEIPLEKLQFTHDRIVAELAAGVADESVRSQYERVDDVLRARIAELGGVTVNAAVSEDAPTDLIEAPTVVETGDTIATVDDVVLVVEPSAEELPIQVGVEATIAEAILDVQPSELVTKADTSDELSPVVESGLYVWTDHAKRQSASKRIITPDELDIIRAKQAIRRANRLNEDTIIRFDPQVGTYDRNGSMYADPTESPTIAQNLQAIVETCSHLAYLSRVGKERGIYFTQQEVLEELGLEHMDVLARRMLFREVSRILKPSGAISIVNNYTEGASISMWKEFSFIVTELQPREGKSKRPANREEEFMTPEIIALENRNYTVEELRQLFGAKKIPRPVTQKQAIQLLDALMFNSADFIHRLEENAGDEHVQIVKDVVHTFAQSELGWSAYLSARNARTIRSGYTGFTGVVRQVTGTQQAERFQARGNAETHSKRPSAGH